MQPNATTTRQKDENSDKSRRVAHNNSDSDDWTFVSSASSGGGASRGSSNSTSPERGLNLPTGKEDITEKSTATPGSNMKQHQASGSIMQAVGAQQSTDSTSSDRPVVVRGAKKHISHHKRKMGSCERADDADDESDGMTEINLDEHDDDEHVQVATTSTASPLALVSMKNDADYDVLGEDELHSNVYEKTSDEIVSLLKNRQVAKVMSHTGEGIVVTERKSISTSTEITPGITTISEEMSSTPREPDGLRSLERLVYERAWKRLGPYVWAVHFVAIGLMYITFFVSVLFMRDFIKTGTTFHNNTNPNANTTTNRAGSRLPVDNKTFDSVYLDPTNHAYSELKLMDEEMIECIRRENPNRKEIDHWLSMSSQELDSYHTTQTNIRPFKGLVCYNNEVEWRKRFIRLKAEFSLDLRKVLRQIKRKITNEMLEKEHPALRFRLILNQLEYLEHVDQRRKDRALEKLKAENLELVRRLNKKSSSEIKNKSHHSSSKNNNQEKNHQHKHQKATSSNSLISLESENVRLKHEVESLKSRLAEKAGTVYIKQSLELEKCDRENNALKQFHHQVAQEVSRNLKQIDQSHSMESLAIFEHDLDDSLSSRLALTRASLLHLGDGITKLVARNKILENDLKEAHSLNELMLTDAKNLIEDANQTEIDARQQGQAASSTQLPEQLGGERYITTPDSESLGKTFEMVNYELIRSLIFHPWHEQLQQPRDLKGDWLLKRAKLREKLRRATRKPDNIIREEQYLTDSQHLDHHHQTKHARKLNTRTAPPNHYWTGSKHDVKSDAINKQEQHRRHKLYKSPPRLSNSYNHNSHKNCKHHLRRDEL